VADILGNPIYGAVAACRAITALGTGPITRSRTRLRTSVAKSEPPDFDMPADTGFNFDDGGSATQPAFHDTATAPPLPPDDGQRDRSSALFPAKPQQFCRPSLNGSASDPRAADVQELNA
jgi:hypothetical protein